jgi:hypothetical protein
MITNILRVSNRLHAARDARSTLNNPPHWLSRISLAFAAAPATRCAASVAPVILESKMETTDFTDFSDF